jgi:hypothetical protein
MCGLLCVRRHTAYSRPGENHTRLANSVQRAGREPTRPVRAPGARPRPSRPGSNSAAERSEPTGTNTGS